MPVRQHCFDTGVCVTQSSQKDTKEEAGVVQDMLLLALHYTHITCMAATNTIHKIGTAHVTIHNTHMSLYNIQPQTRFPVTGSLVEGAALMLLHRLYAVSSSQQLHPSLSLLIHPWQHHLIHVESLLGVPKTVLKARTFADGAWHARIGSLGSKSRGATMRMLAHACPALYICNTVARDKHSLCMGGPHGTWATPLFEGRAITGSTQAILCNVFHLLTTLIIACVKQM